MNYPTIIVNYSVIGNISLPVDLCNRTTQQSTRKAIRNIIEKNPLEKPRIIQDQFENKTSILDRETDSDLPRNLKQITNIKSSICNTRKNEAEIASHIAYLLEQPKQAAISDPSSNDQPFLQEILFRKGRQPTYILFTEQSLKDIQRYCTNGSAPTSFRSILAIDTTFNVGSHYITQTTYRNLSLLRKETMTAPWFTGPVLVHRHQEKEDFAYMWQTVKRGNKELENIALIGTDECLELFSGILDETDDKTGHLLGKEHVLKSIQKKFKKPNFPNKQMKWIIHDIFGHPFDSEKKGLMHESNVKKSHKTVPIITCFKKLKERSLRLYRNAIKAIYGEGPYFLSPAYEHLKCTYDQFKDLNRPEKENLLRRMFT